MSLPRSVLLCIYTMNLKEMTLKWSLSRNNQYLFLWGIDIIIKKVNLNSTKKIMNF